MRQAFLTLALGLLLSCAFAHARDWQLSPKETNEKGQTFCQTISSQGIGVRLYEKFFLLSFLDIDASENSALTKAAKDGEANVVLQPDTLYGHFTTLRHESTRETVSRNAKSRKLHIFSIGSEDYHLIDAMKSAKNLNLIFIDDPARILDLKLSDVDYSVSLAGSRQALDALSECMNAKSPASEKDRVIAGVIVGFACGESPFLIVQDSTGKRHEGICNEKWCEKAAREKKWCPDYGEDTESTSREYLGKTIRATVSRTMIEEPGEKSDGVFAQEFSKIEFSDLRSNSGADFTPDTVLDGKAGYRFIIPSQRPKHHRPSERCPSSAARALSRLRTEQAQFQWPHRVRPSATR